MKVFRIEHLELGVGPMCGEVAGVDYWFVNFKEHPIPADYSAFRKFEAANAFGEDHVFGVLSEDNLYGLITNRRAVRNLTNNGFALYVYEVTEEFVVFSHIDQVCFNRAKAKLLDIFDLCVDKVA